MSLVRKTTLALVGILLLACLAPMAFAAEGDTAKLADGDYTLSTKVVTASTYGGANTEFDLTRFFESDMPLVKDGDKLTLSFVYTSSIEMIKMTINDSIEATKTPIEGTENYLFTFDLSSVGIDNDLKLTFTIQAGPMVRNDSAYLTQMKAIPVLDEGKTYTAESTVLKDTSDEASMAAGFLEPIVDITKNADGTYNVAVSVNDEGAKYDSKLYDSEENLLPASADNRTFTITVDSLANPIPLKFGVSMMPAKQAARLVIDPATIAEKPVYTVTFTDGQGKTLKSEPVEAGKAATAPANPTRDGYTFEGWDKDFSNITADLTVNAEWKAIPEPEPDPEPEPEPEPAPVADIWERLGGADAFGTMQLISQEYWSADTPTNTVIIATFNGFWDALSASSLAGQEKAPILLTYPDSLYKTTEDEIKRLGAKKAIIVGGPAAVSNQCADQIRQLGLTVERVGGNDAQETAILVAEKLKEKPSTCILATSFGFWDALSASPYAYSKKTPILLTDAEGIIRSDTLQAIQKAGYTRVVITGGPDAVKPSTENRLVTAGVKDIKRAWGDDAIKTSIEFANFAISEGMSANFMGVATSADYYDALTGGPLCGINNGVLVLASNTDLSATSVPQTNKSSITHAYIFGGTDALSEAVSDAFEATTK